MAKIEKVLDKIRKNLLKDINLKRKSFIDWQYTDHDNKFVLELYFKSLINLDLDTLISIKQFIQNNSNLNPKLEYAKFENKDAIWLRLNVSQFVDINKLDKEE